MIGNAGKKIQNIVDLVKELYERVNQLREQIAELSETLDETHERVDDVEAEQAKQRALLEAIAEDRDIDVESVLAAVPEDDADVEGGTGGEDEAGVEGGPDEESGEVNDSDAAAETATSDQS